MWYLPVDRHDASLQDGSYKDDGDTSVDGDSSSVDDTAMFLLQVLFWFLFSNTIMTS